MSRAIWSNRRPTPEIPKSRLGEEIGRRERARYEALVAGFRDREKLASLSRQLESQAPPSRIGVEGDRKSHYFAAKQ